MFPDLSDLVIETISKGLGDNKHLELTDLIHELTKTDATDEVFESTITSLLPSSFGSLSNAPAEEDSLKDVMNSLSTTIDDIAPNLIENTTNTSIKTVAAFDSLEILIRLDPVLAGLYKDILDSNLRLRSIRTDFGQDAAMMEIAIDTHQCTLNAFETRLLELRDKNSASDKQIEAIIAQLRLDEELEEDEARTARLKAQEYVPAPKKETKKDENSIWWVLLLLMMMRNYQPTPEPERAYARLDETHWHKAYGGY